MIGSVYDYYLTTYAGKQVGKHDIHKKSELKNVYNNIVKISKSSPLYKVDVSEDVQKYAIDLKENARSLHESVNNLLTGDDLETTKSFVSSDDNILVARTLPSSERNISKKENDGNNAHTDLSDEFTFEVLQLATPQINTGSYLDSNHLNFSKGEHYFETTVGNNSYELQFTVNSDDTNRSIQEKLSRLINKANIGIHASVLGNKSRSALEIQSDATGMGFSTELFSMKNSSNHPEDNVVDILGIDNISSHAQNAKFMLNDMEKTSSNNTFTIQNRIEITLNNVNQNGSKTTVSLRDNVDSVLDSVHDLVNTYNNMVDLAQSKSAEKGDSSRLFTDLKRYAKAYSNELEAIGLNFGEDGKLNFDDSILIQSSNDNSLHDSLEKLNHFKAGLVSKTNDISINPMKYVNKVMISYPNPVKTFANPYITSIYSGMMFNGYV